MAENRSALQRYIRQLRELGVSDVVLNDMTAAQARKLLNTRTQGTAAASATAASLRAAPAARSAEPATTDWRKALSDSDTDVQPQRTAPAPRQSATASALPPGGIAFGDAPRDIFSAASAFATLDDIASAAASCNRCPLHKTALNAVPGEGNPNADLVCVGEGPGATEDETGRPFVGAAGKLLSSILEAINLSREMVYICNVVKHRPPGNRNPMPEEIAACMPYLARQLELVKPKVILALGTTAAQTLLNSKVTIGKLRGSVHRYNGVPLIVTYHPAALLRNPAWKRPTWEDVQIVRRILDSTTGV